MIKETAPFKCSVQIKTKKKRVIGVGGNDLINRWAIKRNAALLIRHRHRHRDRERDRVVHSIEEEDKVKLKRAVEAYNLRQIIVPTRKLKALLFLLSFNFNFNFKIERARKAQSLGVGFSGHGGFKRRRLTRH